MHAQLAALAGTTVTAGVPTFRQVQAAPSFKPRLSGLIATAQGTRRVTVLLDTGATHCSICARLAAALGLSQSGQRGPLAITTAAEVSGPQGLGMFA